MAVSRPAIRWTRGGPVQGTIGEDEVARLGTQATATVADSLPLGLAALGTALVTSGALLATWFRPTGSGVEPVLPGILIFGGIVQVLAAMWAYRRNDLLSGTAFGAFGGFFATAGVLGLAARSLFTSPQFGPLGVLVCCFGLIAVFLAVAGWRLGTTVLATYAALAISLFLAGATLIAGLNVATMVASGWAAVAAGLLAFYVAGAYTINSYYGRNVVPLRATERRIQIKVVSTPPTPSPEATT